MIYGCFFEYVDVGCIISVDLYENGCMAIV